MTACPSSIFPPAGNSITIFPVAGTTYLQVSGHLFWEELTSGAGTWFRSDQSQHGIPALAPVIGSGVDILASEIQFWDLLNRGDCWKGNYS